MVNNLQDRFAGVKDLVKWEREMERENSGEETNGEGSGVEKPNFPDNPSESFIMSYDGPHGEYFQELIAKTNERFGGTRAEIPAGTTGEVQGHLIKRMGLITTISNDSSLKSQGFYPITATQSEHLLKGGKLTTPQSNWEDFGIVLYDKSQNGFNPREAQAIYESLMAHRNDLGFSEGDLENKLIIINPGAEVDQDMPQGVRPIIIPGLTQVYQNEVLEKVEEYPAFEGYGLGGGFPLLSQLGNGDRTLYLPDETEDIGLRVLYRGRNLSLNAGGTDLTYSNVNGRINFARSETTSS